MSNLDLSKQRDRLIVKLFTLLFVVVEESYRSLLRFDVADMPVFLQTPGGHGLNDKVPQVMHNNYGTIYMTSRI